MSQEHLLPPPYHMQTSDDTMRIELPDGRSWILAYQTAPWADDVKGRPNSTLHTYFSVR